MQSIDAIRYYVKGAFQGVKETPEVLEQQEEVIANLSAKVDDLVSEGKSEAEALGVALASMGDLGGLAAQFESDDATKAIPTVTAYGPRLDLHVTAASVGVGAVLMILSVVMGMLTEALFPEAALPLLLVLAAAIWWVARAFRAFREDPGAVETREVVSWPRIRRALLIWAAVCFAAMFVNMVVGSYNFWFWPFWVAATGWLSHVWVERMLVARGMFVVSGEADGSAATPAHRAAAGSEA